MSAGDEIRGLAGQLFGLHQRIRMEMREFYDDINLTDAQITALWRLSVDEPAPTARRLADLLGCDASTVTSLVDRLERHGVVVRVAHPTDRRAKILQLTPLGCELRERIEVYFRTASPFAHLDPSEREQLRTLLARCLATGTPAPAAQDATDSNGSR